MMKLQVDRSISGVVCLQLRIKDCPALVEQLRALYGNASTPLRMGSQGDLVSFEVDAEAFRVEVHSDELRLKMPPADLQELIEAIEEYIEEGSELPLDHSFEAFGAEIVGAGISDVVLETVIDGASAEKSGEDTVVADSPEDLLSEANGDVIRNLFSIN